VRITRQESYASPPKRHSRSRLNRWLTVGLLLLALAMGFLIHQQGWHRPLVEFAADPAFAVGALLHRSDLPTLRLDLRFRDYRLLAEQRADALQLGALVDPDGTTYPATLAHADGSAAITMRLLEGHAEMLASPSWPFAVTVESGDAPFGLRRFVLIPANETALANWGYLETLRRAGLPTPRYEFVRLLVNGSPWGAYALEEVPAGSPARPVISFDATAYWQAFVRQGALLPGDGFAYAEVAVDCGPAPPAQDALLCWQALERARALRAGQVAPSAAFDVEQMADFLALTALWQGTVAPDWRTLRLVYDPQRALFEPLGTAARPGPAAPLPAALLDDPPLQAAWARALAAFSSPDSLARLRDDLAAQTEALRQALGSDLGRLELPWAALEAHQTAMRRMVAPTQPLLAYLQSEPTALVLVLSNTQPFPVEVAGLDVEESVYLPLDPAWVDQADRAMLVDGAEGVVLRAAATVHLRVEQTELPAMAASPPLHVIARLWGFPEQHIAVAVRYDELSLQP